MVAEAKDRRSSVDPPPATGVAAVSLRIRELIAFANYYLAAQVDRFKLTAVNIAMFAVLGLFGLAIGVAVIVTAAVLLVVGIAGAVGALCAHTLWAGQLITSTLIIIGLLAGVVVGFKIVTKTTRGKLKAAYDQRKHDQRSTFGTDVEQESR